MTASRIPSDRTSFTSPVVDYEPPPAPLGAICPTPTPAALHRGQMSPPGRLGGQMSPPGRLGGQMSPPGRLRDQMSPPGRLRDTPRPLRPVAPPSITEPPPPRAAAVFADAALRRVLEVTDRRRPVAQLRPLLAPALVDAVAAMTRSRNSSAATLRRVRLRVAGTDLAAAEVFATYTRGDRVRAIAARVELVAANRWQIVALQIG